MKITACVLLTTALAATANAEFVNMRYLGTAEGMNVRMTYNGHSRDVFAGQLRHRISGASSQFSGLNGDHLTYCSDIAETVTSSYRQYEIVDVSELPDSHPMGDLKASALRSLYAAAGASAMDSTNNDTFAAAFQVAIWEVVTDFNGTAASLNLNAGDFKAKKTNGQAFSGTMASTLASLFQAVMHTPEGLPTMIGLKSDCNQDQILTGFSVPAPGSLALLGLGGLVTARRRR